MTGYGNLSCSQPLMVAAGDFTRAMERMAEEDRRKAAKQAEKDEAARAAAQATMDASQQTPKKRGWW